jgi:hypothetical protein
LFMDRLICIASECIKPEQYPYAGSIPSERAKSMHCGVAACPKNPVYHVIPPLSPNLISYTSSIIYYSTFIILITYDNVHRTSIQDRSRLTELCLGKEGVFISSCSAWE